MTVTYRVKMVYYKTVVYQEAGNLHPVWFNNLDIFRHIEELLAQTKKTLEIENLQTRHKKAHKQSKNKNNNNKKRITNNQITTWSIKWHKSKAHHENNNSNNNKNDNKNNNKWN